MLPLINGDYTHSQDAYFLRTWQARDGVGVIV